MATLAEIQRAYENAQRSGNIEDAQTLARILDNIQQRSAPRVTEEDIIARAEQRLESLAAQPRYRSRDDGLLTNVASGLGAGFVGLGEIASLGAASVLEEEDELAAREKIQSVAEYLRPESGDPDAISYKLASGLGSILGVFAPAALAAAAPVSAPVAAGIGLGGSAALGIGAGAGEASERARAAGATEEERNIATRRGAAIGSLEVIPLVRVFKRIPKVKELFEAGGDELKEDVGTLRELVTKSDGKVTREITSRESPMRGLLREPRTALGRVGRTGVEEGIQEAAAGILQNLNERGYNVERELIDAGVLEEGAIGAGSGAILQGIVELFTRGRSRGAEPPPTEEEVIEEQQLLGLPSLDPLVRIRMPDGSVGEVRKSALESARLREQEAKLEQRGLPAPDPDKLVQVRMPDGSVGEVRVSDIEAAERQQREALEAEERRQADLSAQMDAIQRVEREDAQQREREQGVDLPEAEVRAIEEQRARSALQDEQIDAFTLEREIEQRRVDAKQSQDRRAAKRLGLRDDQLEEQPVLPGFEQDTEVQRDMFGRRRVKGTTEVRMPDGSVQEVPSEVPTIRRQKVTPESERLMTKPAPAPEQQEMLLGSQRDTQKQIEPPLIGPKGGIPRRRREPFKQPEPRAQEPAQTPDIITEERLNDLGIAPKSVVRKALINKDLNQPDIQQRLRNFAESPRAGSKQARANVARLLDGISERQADLFQETGPRVATTGVSDARVSEPQQGPSGVGVRGAVPDVGGQQGVPIDQPDTEVAVAPEGTGVADARGRTGEPVRGAVDEQPALSETDQQLLTRLEDKTTPLTEQEVNAIGGELTLRTNTGEVVDPKILGLFLERVRGQEQEITKQKDAKQTKTTRGTKPGEKATSPKQVTQKDKKDKAPAEQKKKVKAKSTPKKEAPKRAKLGDDPEVRARLENLKKDIKDKTTYERYAAPNTNTIPDDADPVTDNDNKIVANKLKVGTKNNVEDKAIEAYLGRRERVIDGLDAAIYDVVVGSETSTSQPGRSDADKKFFANTGATIDKNSPDGKSPAGRVVAWAEKNLGKETQFWMKKRRAQLEMQDLRMTAKRAGEDVVVKEREAEEKKKLASTQRARAKAELETYTQDDPFMTPAERRRAKRVMAAIDEFMDETPLELRTEDVVLGMEIHPVAVASLNDGDIAGALRIVASSPDKDVARFASAFAERIGDTKVELFSDSRESALAGSFDPKTNTIRLNTAGGISQHALLHEVGHALTSATIANPSHPLTKQLTTLYNDVKDMLGTAYGTQSLDEFVAEAQSNRQFRAELAGINPNGSKINALQKFKNFVGNFFRRMIGRGPKDIESAMTKADALINEIIAPAPEYRDAEILAMSSTYDGVKQVAKNGLDKVQEVVGKPLTKKGREEIGQLGVETIDGLGEQYGNIPLKFLDMSGFVDVAKATNAKLGEVAQKALVAMEKMRGGSAKRDTDTRDAIKPIERWFDKTSEDQTALFNDIIYNREYGATIFQVDPTLSRADAKKKYEGKPDKDGNDLWAIWQENQKQWNKLEPEGKKVFKDMQAFYREQFKELKEVIFSRIETMASGDTEIVTKLKTEFEKRLFDKKGMEVYFPLVREGKYKIGFRYKPGKTPKGQDSFVFEMHQNRSDWLAQLREIESNPDMELVRSSDNETFADYADKAPASSFVNQALQLLRASKVDKDVEEAFMRMVISTLPESSLARSLQSRKNTAGHESDALYAMKTKGFDLGRQIEKLKFSGSMQNVLSDLEKVASTEREKFSPEQQWKLDQSIKDLRDRMRFAVSGAKYKEIEGFVRVANQVAFVGTIGFNTASAIVQTAQIPMVVMPMMMAKYGVKPTMQAMHRAMRIVMSARNHRPEKMDFSKLSGKHLVEEATDIANKFSPAYGIDAYYKREGDRFVVRDDLELTPEHRKELEEFAPLVKQAADRGHLNRSFIADAIGLMEGGRAKRKDSAGETLLSWLDTGTAISAMMFNQSERFNRQVSMLMSYDLAKQDAVSKGKPINESALIENAFRETHQLNGGSTLETAPPIVQQNIGRVAGMYKTYGMRMYTTMINVGRTALGHYNDILKAQGVPDAEIKERVSIARKQAFGILGSSLFFSGLHGVPLYGAVQLLYDAFAGEDEDDFNTIVRDYVGEGWYKGAVNKMLAEAGVGIDVASRVRLTGLLLQTNRYNNDPSMEETLMYYAGGPAWSVAKRTKRGLDDMWNGEFQRGVESVLPVGISNSLKVLGRYQQDGGIYSRRGDPIYDDITGGEMIGQFFGFAPAEYTRIQENNQRVKRIDNALSRRMSALRKKYYIALRTSDYETLRTVIRDINTHNRKHPSFRITPDSIRRSMKQHMKTSSEMYNGVSLSPAMRQAINSQLEAERNGFIALPD